MKAPQVTLRKLLAELKEGAEKIRGFVQRKLETFPPDERDVAVGNLWDNSEPCFLRLLTDYCGILETLRMFSDKELEAGQTLGRLVQVSTDVEEIDVLLNALGTNDRVADEYLAACPEKKKWKKPGMFLTTMIIVLGYVHYWWWSSRGKNRVKNDD